MRTETIPISDITLKDGEEIFEASFENGVIVVTIIDREEASNTANADAGQRFLQTSREIAAMDEDQTIWTDPDPRLRRILDR